MMPPAVVYKPVGLSPLFWAYVLFLALCAAFAIMMSDTPGPERPDDGRMPAADSRRTA